jgi:hypothetical protein
MSEMEWEEIASRLFRSKVDFLAADRSLLEVNANERSITHKFAEHLQRQFPGWNVDCEYNRNGSVPKRLLSMAELCVTQADEDGHTVFPDIIVHRRGQRADSGQRPNLLVIEAKKSGNHRNTDREKLAAFRSEKRYAYAFSVALRFITEEPCDVEIQRCPEPGAALNLQ